MPRPILYNFRQTHQKTGHDERCLYHGLMPRSQTITARKHGAINHDSMRFRRIYLPKMIAILSSGRAGSSLRFTTRIYEGNPRRVTPLAQSPPINMHRCQDAPWGNDSPGSGPSIRNSLSLSSTLQDFFQGVIRLTFRYTSPTSRTGSVLYSLMSE